MSYLALLHFLRPMWLLALPVILLTWWLVRRRERVRAQIETFIAPHLRQALTVNNDAQRGVRPVDGLAVALVLAAVAAAGPTWSKQPSPWFSESAPLVIAVEVSDSMRSNDLQPTRLDRARFKILDLIGLRTGSRTALIAYSGSAHVVLPPSKDVDVIKPFLESLDPAIMPRPGANAATVLPLARDLLGDRASAGTLLFVNDGFEATDIPALAEFAGESGAPSMVALVMGTEEGGVALLPNGAPARGPDGARLDTTVDTGVLRRIASQANLPVVRTVTGDGDIRSVLRRVESNLRLADDPDAIWRDEAWWFLWPTALLTLLWFRRGWTMQW